MWMKMKGPGLKPTDSNFSFSDLSSILLSALSAREGKKLPSRNFSVRAEVLGNPNLAARLGQLSPTSSKKTNLFRVSIGIGNPSPSVGPSF